MDLFLDLLGARQRSGLTRGLACVRALATGSRCAMSSPESDEADLLTRLATRKLICSREIESIEAMRRSAEGCAVQLPDARRVSDRLVTLLAGAFAKGEHGAPAIP
jgi:hypothetical protein